MLENSPKIKKRWQSFWSIAELIGDVLFKGLRVYKKRRSVVCYRGKELLVFWPLTHVCQVGMFPVAITRIQTYGHLTCIVGPSIRPLLLNHLITQFPLKGSH